MASMEAAARFLVSLDRGDLAALLPYSTFDLKMVEIWDGYFAPHVFVYSPEAFDHELRILSKPHQNRIREAIVKTSIPADWDGGVPTHIEFIAVDAPFPEEQKLLPELLMLRREMIEAAEDEKAVANINDYYRKRYRWVAEALKARGWENPIGYPDLRPWRTVATQGHDSANAVRRTIDQMFGPLFEKLIHAPPPPAVPVREPTGWERVDRALEKAHRNLPVARHEEDFQAIGLVCREILISLGQSVYVADVHGAVDGVVPSKSDGERMIAAFLNAIASGESNEKLRRHAKASMALALELQHKRTADFRSAALCLEATASVTNIISILAGRRG